MLRCRIKRRILKDQRALCTLVSASICLYFFCCRSGKICK